MLLRNYGKKFSSPLKGKLIYSLSLKSNFSLIIIPYSRNTFKRVDFPAPLGPSIVIISLGLAVKVISLNISRFSPLCLKVKFFISSILFSPSFFPTSFHKIDKKGAPVKAVIIPTGMSKFVIVLERVSAAIIKAPPPHRLSGKSTLWSGPTIILIRWGNHKPNPANYSASRCGYCNC